MNGDLFKYKILKVKLIIKFPIFIINL